MQAHQQKQAAVQQQQRQLIQQLQQRRAALLTQGLYKRGAHLPELIRHIRSIDI